MWTLANPRALEECRWRKHWCWDMFDSFHVVGRVFLGWCGVSLIVAGLWIWVATSVRRVDRTGVMVSLALIVVGGALVWGALTPA